MSPIEQAAVDYVAAMAQLTAYLDRKVAAGDTSPDPEGKDVTWRAEYAWRDLKTAVEATS